MNTSHVVYARLTSLFSPCPTREPVSDFFFMGWPRVRGRGGTVGAPAVEHGQRGYRDPVTRPWRVFRRCRPRPGYGLTTKVEHHQSRSPTSVRRKSPTPCTAKGSSMLPAGRGRAPWTVRPMCHVCELSCLSLRCTGHSGTHKTQTELAQRSLFVMR
jgi:hypothetical protein